jgi:hypothetical protein
MASKAENRANIESIIMKQQKLRQSGGMPPAMMSDDDEQQVGIVQKQRMVPPKQVLPNMLTKEMAEQAAKKYQKNQKQIQQACAKVDGTELPPTESVKKRACPCVIL